MSAEHYQLLGGWLFVFNSSFVRMNQAHRSAGEAA
jgi:hypothetical protein